MDNAASSPHAVAASTSLIPSTSTSPPSAPSSSVPAFFSAWTSAVRARLHSLRLTLHLETPSTLRALSARQPAFSLHTPVSLGLESLIRDAFLDDLYDGRLHCATLRTADGLAVGIVYWRDVEAHEIRSWIKDEQRIRRAALHPSPAYIFSPQPPALPPSSLDPAHDDGLTDAMAAYHVPASALSSHHWIKVELVVTLPSHAHLHLATILLSSALLLSSQAFLPQPSHAVLHIAGGVGNAAAVGLYSRLGFVPIERDCVDQPNRDVWVLLDCRRRLVEMDWSRVLGDDWQQHRALPPPTSDGPLLLLQSPEHAKQEEAA